MFVLVTPVPNCVSLEIPSPISRFLIEEIRFIIPHARYLMILFAKLPTEYYFPFVFNRKKQKFQKEKKTIDKFIYYIYINYDRLEKKNLMLLIRIMRLQ